MESYLFRKITFGMFFGIFIPLCIVFRGSSENTTLVFFLKIIGAGIVIATSILAFYIHAHFPKKHERPADFREIMIYGPYRYVRHPFYSCFILMGFGISMFFLSIFGFIFNILLIYVWTKLVELEEKELLEYWGEDYRKFMSSRGRFFPKLFKK